MGDPLVVLRYLAIAICCCSTVKSFYTSQSYLDSLQRPSVSPPPPVTVSIVSTPEDLQALADVRYNEWYANDESSRCFRRSFRMATADMFRERQREGNTTTVVAWWSDGVTAVGAGEASTVELTGSTTPLSSSSSAFRYVTDIVTAESYRRKGVARSILGVLEQLHPDCTFLLHVVDSNEAALSLYQSLGYTKGVPQGVDASVLAKNAGTEGQVLLWKRIPATSVLPDSPH